MLTVQPEVKAISPLVFSMVVAVGVLQTGCAGCQGPTDRQAASLRRIEAFKQAESLKRAVAPSNNSIPVCPGSLVLPSTLPTQGGHKVILSWNASAPADSKHGAAVGYCIYRGRKHQDPSPELLNSRPFPGTSCADNLVVSDQKYYYVVRAIGLQGNTSDISNEVFAVIPRGAPSSAKAPAPPALLCGQPPAAK